MTSLNNKKILVTRSRRDSAPLVQKLRQLGAQVCVFPTTRISELTPSAGQWAAAENLNRIDALVFSSKNGVRFFLRALKRRFGKPVDNVLFAKIEFVVAVGEATAKLASRFTGRQVIYPQPGRGSSRLLQFLQETAPVKPLQSALIACGAKTDDALATGLAKLGATNVVSLPVYQTTAVDNLPQLPTDIDAAVFFSGSQVEALDAAGHAAALKALPAICLGEKTANILKDLGFVDVRTTKASLIASVVDSLRVL